MIPTLNDMLAMGVPETAAKAWCEGIDKLRNELEQAYISLSFAGIRPTSLSDGIEQLRKSGQGGLQSNTRP